MPIDLWEKGDKITSEKMNSIVNLLNEVEAKVGRATTEVSSINAKVNTANNISKEVSDKVDALITKYEAKLAEVTDAYNKLKAELVVNSNKNQRTSKNSSK